MAIITGLTAERMEEIEDSIVTDGYVSGDDLILQRHDGSTVNAGNVRGAAATAPPVVSSLPGSPTNLQEVYLQTADMLSANVVWHMKYFTSIGNWIYLGGAPLMKLVTNVVQRHSVGDNTWMSLTPGNPCELTLTIAGTYDFSYTASGQEVDNANATADARVALFDDGTQATFDTDAWARPVGNYMKWNLASQTRIPVSANSVIALKGKINSGSWNSYGWCSAFLRAVPVTLG